MKIYFTRIRPYYLLRPRRAAVVWKWLRSQGLSRLSTAMTLVAGIRFKPGIGAPAH